MKAIVMRFAAALMLAASFPATQAWAQEKEKPPMPGMQMPMPSPTPTPKPTPKPSPMPMPAPSPVQSPAPSPSPQTTVPPMPATGMEGMKGMEMPETKPKPATGEAANPPAAPPATPPATTQGGTTLPNLSDRSGWPEPVADSETFSFVLLDLLECRTSGGAGDVRWDVYGWRGGDRNRFWFKSEGQQQTASKSGELEFQALYGRLIAPFYDFQIGLRYDQRRGRRGGTAARVSAAIGLQGLAPYRYEIEPVLFVSHKGDLSARFTASRDVLLTQRAILQGRFETNVAAQKGERFRIGAGLNDVSLGLRLRYEIRREFAPYFGVSWTRRFAGTADFARQDGESIKQLSFVSGVRMWF